MEVLNLNIIPNGVLPVVHVKQYDQGREWRFNLFENANIFTLDGTEVIECDIHKRDGNIVTVAVTNTSDSYIDIETTLQMTACSGDQLGAIKITKGGDEIASINFIFSCQKSPLEGGITSDSAIHNLQQQIADAVADQYDADAVIFDNTPTTGHGIGYAVTSDGLKSYIPKNVSDMDDVTTTTPASGEALVWDGAKWVNGTPSLEIGDLDDVTITTPTDGEILVYNGGSWENQANPASTANFAPDYDDTATYNTNDKVIYQSLLYICLEDSVTGAWDGTKWQNITVADYNAEILPIESGSATNTKAYIDAISTYTETERAVGVWIDGKTIYQKTINITSVSKDTSWHNTAHNISNIDKVIHIDGIIMNTSNEYYPVPNIRPAQTLDNLPVGIELNADRTNVRYMNNWLDSITKFYVTLKYTKV